jgi:hypothetical protein
MFDNKLEPSEAQATFLKVMTDIKVLEQTRSGNILFCDTKNPYLPIYVLNQNGVVTDLYNFFNLVK